MENVMLDKIVVNENIVTYYFTPSEGLKKYFEDYNYMFVEYDVDVSDIPESILVIPFVSNILPLMWLTNSILWIKEIDRTFYDAISNIKFAYQEMYPHFRLLGTLVTAKTIENTYEIKREAIQLFSGGVDANATYIRIKDNNPILLNIQGWYHDGIIQDSVYDSDKQNISEFAKRQNVQSNVVRSNFANIIKGRIIDKNFEKKLGRSWWYGFQHSMAFISITIPLAYKYKVRNIYIASSNTLGYRTACASDPTTDIQFKYATVGKTIHDGFELTRQEKVKLIVDYQRLINMNYPLRVCSFNDKNCCNCEKCFRTILGIVSEGGDISKFDFNINEDLTNHFEKMLKILNEMRMFFPVKTGQIYWSSIKQRIIENQENIKEKKFVDWFYNYDFVGENKKAIFKYRVTQFFPILKRKINNMFL